MKRALLKQETWQETYNQATDVWTGKEKCERKQHCAKACPSLCVVLSIQSLPDLWKRWTVDFTVQQTSKAPPAVSLLLHLLHLSRLLRHSSFITERGEHLHLSHLPEGLWLYENAEDGDPGYNQVCRANSLMMTDDPAAVPVWCGCQGPSLAQVYRVLVSCSDWCYWWCWCCPPARCCM